MERRRPGERGTMGSGELLIAVGCPEIPHAAENAGDKKPKFYSAYLPYAPCSLSEYSPYYLIWGPSIIDAAYVGDLLSHRIRRTTIDNSHASISGISPETASGFISIALKKEGVSYNGKLPSGSGFLDRPWHKAFIQENLGFYIP